MALGVQTVQLHGQLGFIGLELVDEEDGMRAVGGHEIERGVSASAQAMDVVQAVEDLLLMARQRAGPDGRRPALMNDGLLPPTHKEFDSSVIELTAEN